LNSLTIIAFFNVGGLNAIKHAALQHGISLSLISDYSLKGILSILLNPFAWSLGYFGMPHVLTKFMGAADSRQMHKAKYVGVTWQILATFSAVAVGLVGIAYFSSGVPGKPEFIFIEMTKSLFDPWFAGIVLCAILAATISTVDSQLLVLASIVAQDFYKNLFYKQATTGQILLVYRCALLGAALTGFAIAWNEESTIMALVKYAWSGLGSAFGPLMILSLYSNKINKYGAIAGIVIGAIVSALWNSINPLLTTMTIYSIVPGFMSGLVVIYGISLIINKK
jgi:solute:Na+ symporter, SSS family